VSDVPIDRDQTGTDDETGSGIGNQRWRRQFDPADQRQ
jgi:hypothetical protein